MEEGKMDENEWGYHGEGNKSLVVAHAQDSFPHPVAAAWPHAVPPPLGCSSYCQARVGQRLSSDQDLGSTDEKYRVLSLKSVEFSLADHGAAGRNGRYRRFASTS